VPSSFYSTIARISSLQQQIAVVSGQMAYYHYRSVDPSWSAATRAAADATYQQLRAKRDSLTAELNSLIASLGG
jgi:cell division protein FtsB